MTADPSPRTEMVLYQTEDGRTRIQCRFEDETIWLTQAQIAELFQVTVPTVNEHLKDIWSDGEVAEGATIRKLRIVRTEGSREVAREIDHYRLEAILAVGYASAVEAEMAIAREGMEAMFSELGFDVDLSGLGPDLSEEELAARTAELFDGLKEQQQQSEAAWSSRDRPGRNTNAVRRRGPGRWTRLGRTASVPSTAALRRRSIRISSRTPRPASTRVS